MLAGKWANWAKSMKVAVEPLLYHTRYGMDVIDVGVALLSMHAPYEIASKVGSVYMAYKAYKAFFKDEY